MKKKIKRICAAVVCLLFLFLVFFAVSGRLRIVRYTLKTDKISAPVRIALVTDLHSCRYGEGEMELIEAIEDQQPDVVFLVGDIFDDVLPHDNAVVFVRAMAERYPCFYVSGNHEYWSGDIEWIKTVLRETGITVLEGNGVRLEINGQIVDICGVDDPEEIGRLQLLRQVETGISNLPEGDGGEVFRILLTHRPELIDDYLYYGFDLILSGHAHGGQWRIPGIINGLLAPNQGLFPLYAGGEYTFSDSTMIVSRGLARESTRIPRIFNRPELVIIDLIG